MNGHHQQVALLAGSTQIAHMASIWKIKYGRGKHDLRSRVAVLIEHIVEMAAGKNPSARIHWVLSLAE